VFKRCFAGELKESLNVIVELKQQATVLKVHIFKIPSGGVDRLK
jgi:hypothetical protein